MRGIGAGVVGLVGTNGVAATETTEFVVAGTSRSRESVDQAGFRVKNIISDGVYSVSGPADQRPALEQVSGIDIVTPNRPVSSREATETEPTMSEPSRIDDQWDKEMIDAFDAHEHATGDGTRIAIVDTGIDHTHPDLGNVNTAESVSILGGNVGDHSGDIGYHGTHSAGIAAATGAEGVVGVAPDAELVSIRVFGFGGGTFEDVLLAIRYATAIECDVVNLSLGSLPLPPQENADGIRGTFNPVCRATTRKGTLVTSSVGNEETDLQRGQFVIPSSSAGILSVSATGRDDRLASYSNYGTSEVDIAAPGGGRAVESEASDEDEILSTVPGGWMRVAGTSMAAPQVAGLAALVRELDQDRSVQRITNAIKHGAEGANGRGDPALGAGRVNALDTVTRV